MKPRILWSTFLALVCCVVAPAAAHQLMGHTVARARLPTAILPIPVRSDKELKVVPTLSPPNQQGIQQVRSCVNLAELKRSCGEGLTGLLDLVLDRREFDGQMKVLGQLTPSNFALHSGQEAVRSWTLQSIKMPLETVDDKCFAIRVHNGYPEILCTPSRRYRNFWINSIHESVLCEKNGGVNGKLPVDPGPEEVAEAEGIVVEEKPAGINIHLDKDASGKDPLLLINGIPVNEITKEKKKESEELSEPPAIKVKVEDVALDEESSLRGTQYHTSETVVNMATNFSEPEPEEVYKAIPSFDTQLALQESDAEKNRIPATDAPPYGFLAMERDRLEGLRSLKSIHVHSSLKETHHSPRSSAHDVAHMKSSGLTH